MKTLGTGVKCRRAMGVLQYCMLLEAMYLCLCHGHTSLEVTPVCISVTGMGRA